MKGRKVLPSESGLIVHNGLPDGPDRLRIEEALRTALSDLPGSWKVSIGAVGRRLYTIEVAAPDASHWSVAIPIPEGPRPEDVADMVRAACARRSTVKPPGGPIADTVAGRGASQTKAATPRPDAVPQSTRTGQGSH